MNNDEEQLKLLAIFHYVVAGLVGLFSLIPIIHLILGLFIVFGARHMAAPGQPPPPAFLGYFFILIAVVFIVGGLILASCIFLAGRFLARRRHYQFCFVMAAVECLVMPFGTVLGVFSILALNRDSVKRLFAAAGVSSAPQNRF